MACLPRENQVIEKSSFGALLVTVSCGGNVAPQGAYTVLFQSWTGPRLDLSEEVITFRENTDDSLWFHFPFANRENIPVKLEESTYLGETSLLADVSQEGAD